MNAQVNIQTSCRDGISYPIECYFTPPFRVVNITEDKHAGPLDLMLMNSSPGILDRDQYEIKISVAENSSLTLHTQSYQRLFNMKKGAIQCMEVRLDRNASFVYLPHPSVPHEHSIFTAHNKVYITETSRLVWGEVLTCGRKLNGEVFQFSRYHNITEIYINDKLVIKENLLMQPSLIDPRRLGQLEGFTHQASLIIYDKDITERIDEVHEYLSIQTQIIAGVTTTMEDGMIVRILGNGAEQLHLLLHQIVLLLQKQPIIKPATEYAG
jgi:urease accessory protein